MMKFPALSAFLLLVTTHLPVKATSTTDKVLVPLEGAPPVDGDIVGGEDAAPGDFPYYAHTTGDGVCGGALIATNIVLTAAHCSSLFKKGREEWIVGSTDILFTEEIDSEFQESIAQETFSIHPDYNSQTTENDYAIIVLQEEFTNDNVGFIAPANKDYQDDVDQLFVVMGRGLTSDGGELADKMQKATVFNVDIDTCVDNYNGDVYPDVMICAAADGIDSCGGDSGGPMVDENDIIVGIVSWGIGCADPAYPGVYSRVSAGWEWINEQVCENAISVPDWAECGAREENQGCNSDPNMSRWEWVQCLLGFV